MRRTWIGLFSFFLLDGNAKKLDGLPRSFGFPEPIVKLTGLFCHPNIFHSVCRGERSDEICILPFSLLVTMIFFSGSVHNWFWRRRDGAPAGSLRQPSRLTTDRALGSFFKSYRGADDSEPHFHLLERQRTPPPAPNQP